MARPKVKFLGEECSVEFRKYQNGRTALELICEDGSPMAVATVNIPEVPINEHHVFVKDWSENEGMAKALTDAGYIKPTGHLQKTGHVHAVIAELLIKE